MSSIKTRTLKEMDPEAISEMSGDDARDMVVTLRAVVLNQRADLDRKQYRYDEMKRLMESYRDEVIGAECDSEPEPEPKWWYASYDLITETWDCFVSYIDGYKTSMDGPLLGWRGQATSEDEAKRLASDNWYVAFGNAVEP